MYKKCKNLRYRSKKKTIYLYCVEKKKPIEINECFCCNYITFNKSVSNRLKTGLKSKSTKWREIEKAYLQMIYQNVLFYFRKDFCSNILIICFGSIKFNHIILLSLSIWGILLGFIGLIIALPLTTLCLSYYKRFILEEKEPEPVPDNSKETNK